MKNKKVLLVMLIIAAVLGAVYAGIKLLPKEEQDSGKHFVVPLDSPTNVSAVEVEYGGEEYKLIYEDGWHLEGDRSFPVDQNAALAMANALCSVFADSEIEMAGDESEYGLDAPQCIIRAWDGDGCEYSYAIGGYNDYVDKYYLKAGEGKLYLADSTLPNLFFTSKQDMIEIERLPDIYESEVTKLVVKREGETVEYENTENSAEAIKSFAGLYFYGCAAYAVEEGELAKYGLDAPVRAELYYTKTETVPTGKVDDEGRELTEKVEREYSVALLFGADDGEGRCYVMYPGSGRIYTASASECRIITQMK